MMPHPVTGDKSKAEYQRKKFILECYYLVPHFCIGAVFCNLRNFKFYYEQGDSNRKNSVAEKSNTLHLEILFRMPGSMFGRQVLMRFLHSSRSYCSCWDQKFAMRASGCLPS